MSGFPWGPINGPHSKPDGLGLTEPYQRKEQTMHVDLGLPSIVAGVCGLAYIGAIATSVGVQVVVFALAALMLGRMFTR